MGIYFCQNNSSQTDQKGYLKFFIRLCIISNKMAAYLEENIVVIKDCVQKNYTYQQISELLQQKFPDVRQGFSVRNIRLFCSRNAIKKLNDIEVDAIVQQSLSEVI